MSMEMHDLVQKRGSVQRNTHYQELLVDRFMTRILWYGDEDVSSVVSLQERTRLKGMINRPLPKDGPLPI